MQRSNLDPGYKQIEVKYPEYLPMKATSYQNELKPLLCTPEANEQEEEYFQDVPTTQASEDEETTPYKY